MYSKNWKLKGVNKLIFSLPDWVIRIDGIIMLIGILTVSYSIIKSYKKEK